MACWFVLKELPCRHNIMKAISRGLVALCQRSCLAHLAVPFVCSSSQLLSVPAVGDVGGFARPFTASTIPPFEELDSRWPDLTGVPPFKAALVVDLLQRRDTANWYGCKGHSCQVWPLPISDGHHCGVGGDCVELFVCAWLWVLGWFWGWGK